jgi:hypothetical protein
MSLRADRYRQKAAEAKQNAAQAFEDVAACWRRLAEQTEWIDSQKVSTPQQKNQFKGGPGGSSPRAE